MRLDLASSHRAIGNHPRRYHITYAEPPHGPFIVGRHLLDAFTRARFHNQSTKRRLRYVHKNVTRLHPPALLKIGGHASMVQEAGKKVGGATNQRRLARKIGFAPPSVLRISRKFFFFLHFSGLKTAIGTQAVHGWVIQPPSCPISVFLFLNVLVL